MSRPNPEPIRQRDPDAPRVNELLLDLALSRIVNEPASWDQSTWGQAINKLLPTTVQPGDFMLCGTTACLAGHLMLESGQWRLRLKRVDRNNENVAYENVAEFVNLRGETPDPFMDIRIPDLAGELLGLTGPEQRYLFGVNYARSMTPKQFARYVRAYLGLPPKKYKIKKEKVSA